MAAKGLLGRVPVEPFGARVPGGDGPIQRLADDGVVRRADDGCQLLRGFLRPPSLGDVPQPDGEDRAAVDLELRDGCLEWKFNAVPPPPDEDPALVHRPDGVGRGREAFDVLAVHCVEAWREQDIERLADHLGRLVAEGSLSPPVEEPDTLRCVNGNDGVVRELHDVLEVGLQHMERASRTAARPQESDDGGEKQSGYGQQNAEDKE